MAGLPPIPATSRQIGAATARFAISVTAAVTATVAAVVVTWMMQGLARDTMYVFFVAAVALVAETRGALAGLSTVALCSAAVVSLFLAPSGELSSRPGSSLAQVLSFASVGSLIVWLTHALCKARRAAERLTAVAVEAKVAAESSSAARLDFLNTLSHELRTPINALLGYSDLIEAGAAGPVTADQAAFISRIRHAATHLLNVVNQVLDMAKADGNHLLIASRRVGAAEILESAAALVNPQAAEKHVVIEVPANAQLEFVGDADRARQILVNLLANAVKFTPPGGHVSIELGQDEPSAPRRGIAATKMFWIRVSDDGPGVLLEDQERIFEPFKQARDRRTESLGGTGLGLAISRRLARLMNGDVTVRSDPGRGASFTMKLPRP